MIVFLRRNDDERKIELSARPAKVLNTRRQLHNPLIVLICGLPGVGKTTLANALAPLIDAVLISSDRIRKELMPKPVYGTEEKELVYNIMFLLAKYLHGANMNCILDATFNSEKSRKEALDKIGIQPAQLQIVECVCPEDIVISRLRSRKEDYSDADVTVYTQMKQTYETIQGEHMIADTSRSPEANARNVKLEILRSERRTT